MKTYINLILSIATSFVVGCKTPSIEIAQAPCKYGDIDIFSIEKNKTHKVILFIPDDDSVSIEKQVTFFLPLLGKNTSLYTFPKYKYENVIDKDNADNPEFRLELLVASYQNLVATEKIKETQELVVVGLGEGSLIAPHFSRLINASKLLLINPLYHSYKENISIAYTEKNQNATDLKANFGFTYANEWLEFFDGVEKKNNPDKSAGQRTYRYYSSYWNYYPGQFIGTQIPTQIILFKSFFLSSEFDKNYMLNIKQPNITSTLLEGYMFSKFSESELKKLDFL